MINEDRLMNTEINRKKKEEIVDSFKVLAIPEFA
jgi:hypothetical protein